MVADNDATVPPSDKPVISWAEAKARDLKRYFTGKPCSHGHVAERRTGNRNCIACVQLRDTVRYDANREDKKAQHRAWYAANKDNVNEARRTSYAANRNRERAARADHKARMTAMTPRPSADEAGLSQPNGIPSHRRALRHSLP